MPNGGIDISDDAAASLGTQPSVTVSTDIADNVDFSDQQLGWRPPQWSQAPATYSITAFSSSSDLSTRIPGSGVVLVFDAVLSASHEKGLNLTRHPVQTGFNISDGAVLQQSRLTLEVSMSDAMQAYETGMWSGNPSKSVSAFQQMQALMANRYFLTISTRLITYENMVLIRIRSIENSKTFRGAAMVLEFEEVFLVTTADQTNSARAQTTGSTNLNNVQTLPVDDNTEQQFGVDNPDNNIPGAGDFSSNITGETFV